MSAPTGSPLPQDPILPANPLPALPAPPQPSTNPRRLPPPCWSHDETVALIDAYRDKWYTLRRGNLKANHWQEVADAVGHRCPTASPPKTAVQCRHKMEKLRKRYRTEIQRARSMPVSRFSSSWVHFKRMDAMEKGPQAKQDYNSESNGEDDDNDDDEEDENQGFFPDSFKNGAAVSNTRSIQKLYRNVIPNSGSGMSGSGVVGGGGSSAAAGFRIRIPTGVSIAQPPPPSKLYAKVDPKFGGMNPNLGSNGANSNAKPSFGGMMGGGSGSRVMRGSDEMMMMMGGIGIGKKRNSKEKERDAMEEMVAAIKVLGDGFVRMEQMKMEMAREMESMRMEMEMKRTEMILESQQRIVEAFAKAVSEKRKKPKRMASPAES